MRLYINQPPRPRDGGVIRRRFRQRDAHKLPQRQRVGQPPGDAVLAVDAFAVADQQRTEVDSWNQAGTSHGRRVELAAKTLDKDVKLFIVQKLVQPRIERMARRVRQF